MLKLGNSNVLAEEWLARDEVFIMFGSITAEQINDAYTRFGVLDRRNRLSTFKREDATLFNQIVPEKVKKIKKRAKDPKSDAWNQVFTLIDGARAGSWFMTYVNFHLYVYKLARDGRFEDREGDYHPKEWRVIPPRITIPVAWIPRGLSSIFGVKYYMIKTCVKLNDAEDSNVYEAVQVARMLLGEPNTIPRDVKDRLKYLDPIEFETLVFHILTQKKLHVPAWRGGSLGDIDLVAFNFTDDRIMLPEWELSLEPLNYRSSTRIAFLPTSGITFQVKRKIVSDDEIRAMIKAREGEGITNRPKHYLIGLNNEFSDDLRTEARVKGDMFLIGKDRLIAEIERNDTIMTWVRRSLSLLDQTRP
jgi:hypothetical protein